MEINIVLAMSTLKKAKVVMIPTNEKSLNISPIVLYNKKLFSCYSSKYEYEKAIFQHLYIISDDEIKEGDWKYDTKLNIVIQHGSYIDGCKKVIATTEFTPLPQPSQQLIEKYIEEYNKGNIITDVLVECEETISSTTWEHDEPEKLRLKINPEYNSIIIKKVKDNYTREEVENLIYSAMKDRCYTTIAEWKKWIEENL